jgi:hypothetical protein
VIIEAGLVKAGLVKTSLSQAIQQIRQRYFRRNEGTTDYADIPQIALAGDVVIEFDVSASAQDDNKAISFRNDNAVFNIGSAGTGDGDNKLRVFSDSPITSLITTMPVFDGILHNVRLEYNVSLSTVSVLIDGVEGIPATTVNYDFSLISSLQFWRESGSSGNLSGILANLKIYDNGTLVRDYPLDDNSSILRERVSGQDGLIVNGTADQWGLFQQQDAGEWLGQELVVNGGFGNDNLSQWTAFSSSLSVVNGQLNIDTSSTSNAARVEVVIPVSTYRFSVQGVSQTAPALKYSVVNITASQTYVATTAYGVSKFSIDVSVTSSGNVGFYALRDSGSVGTYVVDNVSVKEVLNVA